jgi:putative peptidoglycan lipid II flippase
VLASVLPVGSLTVFNLANNLQGLPLTIFGASFAVAAFPTLATLAARENMEKFRSHLSSVLRQILFFVIPLSVLIIILRAQIVRIVLGTGKFDWEDTVLTLSVLGVLAISLFAQSVNLLLARAFFALHNTMTPLKAGVIGVVLNAGLGFMAIKYWNRLAPFWENHERFQGMQAPIVGVALAYTISQLVIFICLFISLYSRLNGMGDLEIRKSIKKICLATIIMGAVVQGIKMIWGELFPLLNAPNVLSQVIIAGAFGVLVYLFICKNLNCREVKILQKEYEKISKCFKK